MIQKLSFQPSDAITFNSLTERQHADLMVKNGWDKPIIFKMKSTRPSSFKMRPVYGLVNVGEEKKIRLLFKGFDNNMKTPCNRDRFTVVLAPAPENCNDAARVWRDGKATQVTQMSARKVLKVIYNVPGNKKATQIAPKGKEKETASTRTPPDTPSPPIAVPVAPSVPVTAAPPPSRAAVPATTTSKVVPQAAPAAAPTGPPATTPAKPSTVQAKPPSAPTVTAAPSKPPAALPVTAAPSKSPAAPAVTVAPVKTPAAPVITSAPSKPPATPPPAAVMVAPKPTTAAAVTAATAAVAAKNLPTLPAEATKKEEEEMDESSSSSSSSSEEDSSSEYHTPMGKSRE
ncbi:hypothetical protein QR680_016775 [Steinernema hermaphroditum]|uniref:Major sperm protein n=1 Tax=Steinernema hermaphroditum TaxID=289476 RepID=A0AA39HEP7_9BILA|nr:hypothetical protein QR680_016775 [Steinernema hermaphroditum]